VQKKRLERVLRQIARDAAEQARLRGSEGTLPEDNTLCVLCHQNLSREKLVSEHLARGVTCVACHGLSFEHMDDETSRTKPDFTYGRAQVTRFCRRCHAKHDDPEKVAEFLGEWKGKRRPNGRLILKQAMCTDCHGEHVITTVPVTTG